MFKDDRVVLSGLFLVDEVDFRFVRERLRRVRGDDSNELTFCDVGQLTRPLVDLVRVRFQDRNSVICDLSARDFVDEECLHAFDRRFVDMFSARIVHVRRFVGVFLVFQVVSILGLYRWTFRGFVSIDGDMRARYQAIFRRDFPEDVHVFGIAYARDFVQSAAI